MGFALNIEKCAVISQGPHITLPGLPEPLNCFTVTASDDACPLSACWARPLSLHLKPGVQKLAFVSTHPTLLLKFTYSALHLRCAPCNATTD